MPDTNLTILGISAYYHDAAAAIIKDGKILAAAQEERFTRKKNDASFPAVSITWCLKHTGFQIEDIDAIAFYDKPFLKFERLLETYYGFAPKGLVSFARAIPVWMKEKMFLKKTIRHELKKLAPTLKKLPPLFFPEHHLSHAASSFYTSSFKNAAILTLDGVGEWATMTLAHGLDTTIKIHKELHFPHSIGLLYSAFTYYLGFKVNSGEYKLMGLAPYGNPNAKETTDYINRIHKYLIDLKPDGSVWLNQRYFLYPTGLRMVREKKWRKIFGFSRRKPDDSIEQHHCNLAYAIQYVTEELFFNVAQHIKSLTNAEHLCLAGGVALNCVANGKLLRKNLFKDIYIQPAAGDSGGAIGAALAVYYIHFEQPRITVQPDLMQGALLGPNYSNETILRTLKPFKAVYTSFNSVQEKHTRVAELLADGNIVGWFQGRMEFGPRALGNRSILGDPRNSKMQKKLNLKIKYRESFRPFAPAILAEDVSNYFNLDRHSPYMLLVADVNESLRKKVPKNYYDLHYMERLYVQRSELQSITHVDFSARVQTVHKEINPEFYGLINAFKQRTGVPVLINTSFNVRGEPIVCTPIDAYRCFMRTDMDFLIIENYIFEKEKQPPLNEDINWKSNFLND